MTDKKLKFTKVAVGKDGNPALSQVEEIIGLWRAAVAPLLNSNPEQIPVLQSKMITAAAVHAGMTVGHMITVGTLNESDKRRVSAMMQVNFRNGIKVGKQEAQRAILAQTTPAGTE